MRNHTLFNTYLHDLLWKRRLSAEELADRLGHADTTEVRSWLNGWSAPRVERLRDLAAALDADPVVMTLGWQIDADPAQEASIWRMALTPMGATFPKSDDLTLHMTRPHRDNGVGDPHDGHDPRLLSSPHGPVRKRSMAARLAGA